MNTLYSEAGLGLGRHQDWSVKREQEEDWRVPSMSGDHQVDQADLDINYIFPDVLATTYGSWDRHSRRLGIVRDPRAWTRDQVAAIIPTDQGQGKGFYPHLVIFR